MERNKEISFLKKESKSLSRILGEMKQELHVLTTTVNARQAVVGDDCWQEKNSKGFKMRTNHLEDRGNDTIQERSNSDFDVKCATIQFYGNSHNSQFDHWIELKFYVESPDMFSYLGLKFQVNRSLGMH